MTSLFGRFRGATAPVGLLRDRIGPFVQTVAVAVVTLALATAAVAFLEGPSAGIADASPIYLVAVVVVGIVSGTAAAVVTAMVAFVTYDYLFTEPRFTFLIADPRQWLDLLVLFGVALVIGRLTARETARAREATDRARESEALFAISRTLAATPTFDQAAREVAARLALDAHLERVWIGLAEGTHERVIADTGAPDPTPALSSFRTLARGTAGQPPRWIAVHAGRREGRIAAAMEVEAWGVPMEGEGIRLGTLWGARRRALAAPDRIETRLLALAADQLAIALRRERLGREATQAEIARESDALKTALLSSVSHDLRTPLASIRATAGSLMDPDVTWSEEERRSAAHSIDAETERLSQLVESVLDLSRIEGGALHPEVEALDPSALTEAIVDRMRVLRDGHVISLDLAGLPPVNADPVLLGTVLSNLIENAIRHSGPGAPIRIGGHVHDGWVELTVEDGGVGVPDEALPRLFGKFYRVPGRPRGSRPGLGIGLSIAHGFVTAMGGEVAADRSELGGLRVRIRLPVAPEPPLS